MPTAGAKAPPWLGNPSPRDPSVVDDDLHDAYWATQRRLGATAKPPELRHQPIDTREIAEVRCSGYREVAVCLIFVAALGLVLLMGESSATAQAIVSDIRLGDGRNERVVLTSPANPAAILVMFAGGEGTVEITDSGTIGRYLGNFLLRTQPLWLQQGFSVEILAAPNNVSLSGQRHTEAYAEAVGRAVDFVRNRANAPVWLVGTSAGTTGAANAASRLTGKIAGLVLTSSVTRYNVETVFDTDLAAITVPVLIVANQNDACPGTPPGDAPRIAAALVRSPRKEVVYVKSDQIRSSVCEASAPHGFLGIEADVVQRIGDWIRATLAK
jgi:pimeloyl-ACP methyl ester carboxylesterase